MANPVNFPESNAVLRKPDNMTDEECSSLPILRNNGQCVSCWQLSEAEMVNINLTHSVFVGVLSGDTQPPIWVQAAATTDVALHESNLVQHAERELKLAGMFAKDSDYEGGVGEAVLELIRALARQGHSGGSHAITMGVFEKLATFQNLTPITDDPEDWFDHSDTHGGEPLWQCKRRHDAFSRDGGKTYYTLDGPEGREFIHTSAPARA